jgi:alanyl-tRNA synthetase
MLGNWSFGDYYKAEAITWAWELLTDVWKLPKERMWATVYRTDDEAFELWKTKTDINPSHILRFDEKDNFWEMGETGPCGPCSEIHINLSDDYDNPDLVNAGKPECIEIWNLVFIQYNRDQEGTLHDLPAKHVDTGMGFERVCAVLQKKESNYGIDIFEALINKVAELSGVKFEKEEDKIAMRVIADHVRALSFAIADGAVPGNEGRGYVLRRILRRAARYGRNLNLKKPFLYNLLPTLVETMGDVFPELKENQSNIENIIKAEEESFNATLDRGIELFEKIAEKVISANQTIINGYDAFKLYDTYGFPVDLTNVMAREKGLRIDEEKFNELMDEQKNRARKSTKDKMGNVDISTESLDGFKIDSSEPTEFTGYDELISDAKVVGFKTEGNTLLIITDKSPFYVESGGQIGDMGKIIINENNLDILDVRKFEDKIIHILENKENIEIEIGQKVKLVIDEKRRWDIMRNHSVTHFLHAALRNVIGKHVQQAGSFVGPDYLRFDFSHFEKLSAKQISQIEGEVNKYLRQNIELQHHKNIPFDEAKKMGALMFFGDKYGDNVNVVQFGDYSKEFCGGTHVHNSSQIGLFKITSEASIASGVRRIEAVTGRGVEEYINGQEARIQNSETKINELLNEKRKLEKELAELKLDEKLGGIESIISNPNEVEGIKIFKGIVSAENMDELKLMGDELREKMKSGVGMLISDVKGKVGIVVVVSDDIIKSKKLLAGKIVGDTAKLVGGGGGGRPHLATAGGKDISKIKTAVDKFDDLVQSNIKD